MFNTQVRRFRVLKSAGNVSSKLLVPSHIRAPDYAETGKNKFYRKVQIQSTEAEIESMRRSCQLARRTLSFAKSLVDVGVTTDEIDRKVHEFIVSHNAYPSTLNYGKFPKSICTSVNNVMVHGIPDDRPLENGDIINIDVTVYLDGYHGDCSETYFVGDDHSEQAKTLVEVTRNAVYNAIRECGPEQPVTVIGKSVSKTIAPHGFVAPVDFCGHGVGKLFHSNPQINHFKEKTTSRTQLMKTGMTFTIEPIINVSTLNWTMWRDGWTIATANDELSATWEHTVLITNDGVEILTASEDEQRIYKPQQS